MNPLMLPYIEGAIQSLNDTYSNAAQSVSGVSPPVAMALSSLGVEVSNVLSMLVTQEQMLYLERTVRAMKLKEHTDEEQVIVDDDIEKIKLFLRYNEVKKTLSLTDESFNLIIDVKVDWGVNIRLSAYDDYHHTHVPVIGLQRYIPYQVQLGWLTSVKKEIGYVDEPDVDKTFASIYSVLGELEKLVPINEVDYESYHNSETRFVKRGHTRIQDGNFANRSSFNDRKPRTLEFALEFRMYKDAAENAPVFYLSPFDNHAFLRGTDSDTWFSDTPTSLFDGYYANNILMYLTDALAKVKEKLKEGTS